MKRILGLDLAWGEINSDGLCSLDLTPEGGRITETALARGDDALLKWVLSRVGSQPALLAIDAPVVCPNLTGARPVDRLTHVHFGRFHAGCHPANLTRCPRPARVAALLKTYGFIAGWSLDEDYSAGIMTEVYPHPAMVRFFGLQKRIPYKKGPVQIQRLEFARLQRHINQALEFHFKEIGLDPSIKGLLQAPWTKDVEDQTDALFCALIGYWHWRHQGGKTEILGDLLTGFIMIPQV